MIIYFKRCGGVTVVAVALQQGSPGLESRPRTFFFLHLLPPSLHLPFFFFWTVQIRAHEVSWWTEPTPVLWVWLQLLSRCLYLWHGLVRGHWWGDCEFVRWISSQNRSRSQGDQRKIRTEMCSVTASEVNKHAKLVLVIKIHYVDRKNLPGVD